MTAATIRAATILAISRQLARLSRELADAAIPVGDPFAAELVDFIDRVGTWRGTTEELLATLEAAAPSPIKRGPPWPRNPSAARSAIDRARIAIGLKGYTLTRGKSDGRRWLQFSPLAAPSGEGVP